MRMDAAHNLSASEFKRDGLPLAAYRSQAWYLAYMEALFELQRTRMPERITYAEQLIVHREGELFTSRTEMAELRALANALHSLRALRSCFGM